MEIKGIDVSHWQGDIDYEAVKNSGKVDFVIIKAGGSDSGFYEDSKFREYLDGFNSVDIPILGAYYFVGSGFVSTGDGIADADRFCDMLDGTGIPYAILDLESTSVSKYSKEFLKIVEEEGFVRNVSEEIPRSFIICEEKGQSVVYITNISTKALAGRVKKYKDF